jgi:hypothetical protein
MLQDFQAKLNIGNVRFVGPQNKFQINNDTLVKTIKIVHLRSIIKY